LIVLLWIWVQREIGARITHFYYGGFYGKPFSVLLWNIAVSSTIVYVCMVAVWDYVSLVRVAQDRHSQVNALVSICLFDVASVYGMLMVAQTMSDRTGGDLRRLQHIAELLVVVCAGAGVGLILATVYGRPLWLRPREWLPLRQY